MMQEEIKNIESSLPHENSVNSCPYQAPIDTIGWGAKK